MRWEALFDDLETQWSAQQAAQLDADVAESLELERARVHLMDRLRASIGEQLNLHLRGGAVLQARIHLLGADWVSGLCGAQSILVPLQAISCVDQLAIRAESENSRTRARLGIGSPLRALARARAAVLVQGADGELARGVITHVGADHLDVALGHRHQSSFRAGSPRRTVALAAVVAVRST